ncbi:crosslink repair DNA glycosylase YcaQ family protein [Oerskovia sp. M15]
MRISDDTRRARLVAHQLDLGADGPDPVETVEGVVDRLVALHATDAPSVYLSVLARVPQLRLDDVRAAMYEQRSLVRVLAMRRTLFVVARDMVPVVHAGRAPPSGAGCAHGCSRSSRRSPWTRRSRRRRASSLRRRNRSTTPSPSTGRSPGRSSRCGRPCCAPRSCPPRPSPGTCGAR